MFHTFQTDGAIANQANSKNNPKSRRQSSTTHACEECRRRKIRCDGKQPCSHCEWYKHPKLCKYSKKQPRVVPSQKLLDELQNSLKQSKNIIEQLIPNADLDQLGSLPRNELVELILSGSGYQGSSSSSTSPQTSSSDGALTRVQSAETSANLEALEQEPAPDSAWDEVKTSPNGVPAIPDDVNALSMSANRQSSYVGVSSVAAALKVISKITSALESVIISSPHRTQQHTATNSPHRVDSSDNIATISQPRLPAEILINAYFSDVHPMIPMIDEARFRADLTKHRNDPPWLALLNAVFAMGTIAASKAQDNSHLLFYNRARQFLNLESFGSGHIETLQALGILGGYYLHYESRPNMASAIMGAAMRMALAMGLHREYAEDSSVVHTAVSRNALLIPREVRRRTWWSLYCLDTWASTATSRPSLGRISPGVTLNLPAPLLDRSSPERSGSVSSDDIQVMLLTQETAFCKIATKVQDRLAEQPLLPFEETVALDHELRQFYHSLPIMLRWPEPCPKIAQTPRAVLSWRYHNLRIILYRPILLNNALRSSMDKAEEPSEEEFRMVKTCRQIAGEAIDDIRNQWNESHIAGWNAVWLLFQASMVPLVTLFAEFNRRNFKAVRAAQNEVQVVIGQLEIMQDWSQTAKRMSDVLSGIYERNKLLVDQAQQALRSQMTESNQMHQKPQRPTRRQQGFRSGDVGQRHMMQQPYGGQMPPQTHPSMAGPMYEQTGQMSPTFPLGQNLPMGEMVAGSSTGLVPPSGSNGLAGHMGMIPEHNMDESMLPSGAASFVDQAELDAFWNQLLWGEGDISNFMDTSLDGMSFPDDGQEYGYEYHQQ